MQTPVEGRVLVGRGGAGERADVFRAANRSILWKSMAETRHDDPYKRLCEAFSLMASRAGLYPGTLAERSGAAVETVRRMDAWSLSAPPDAADVTKLLGFFGIADQPLERWFGTPGE